ncbi:hypothetical protein GCM10027299_02680 [Larkinella ripae]
MKKLLFSLLLIVIAIVCTVVVSPASIRDTLTTIGSFELMGIGVIAWMINSSSTIVSEEYC